MKAAVPGATTAAYFLQLHRERSLYMVFDMIYY